MKTMSVEEQIKRRGYRTITELFVPSEKLVETASYLKSLDVNKKMNQINRMSLEDTIHDSYAFFQSFYKVHPVPYIKYYIDTRFLKISKTTDVDPFDLPIYPVEYPDEICYGALLTDLPEGENVRIAFRGIELNRIVTELTSCSHVHEITHSQLDSVKGAIKEYYNAEVLSLFNELIVATLLGEDERILRAQDSRRIHEIAVLSEEVRDCYYGNNFKSKNDHLADSQYIISDIRAYNLFAEYYYGTEATQDYIITRIQQIFDGGYSVEELLNEFMDNNLNTRLIDDSKLTFSPKAIKYFER